jgi:6-pyruvoyltetrahydropterin/6-carboxytetrahydropterin synthase
MIIDFAERIQAKLPPHLKLERLILRETETSFAEWFASDQK